MDKILSSRDPESTGPMDLAVNRARAFANNLKGMGKVERGRSVVCRVPENLAVYLGFIPRPDEVYLNVSIVDFQETTTQNFLAETIELLLKYEGEIFILKGTSDSIIQETRVNGVTKIDFCVRFEDREPPVNVETSKLLEA